MKTTLELLTPKERKLLADFYKTDTFKALKHLLEVGRLNTATKLLEVSADDVVNISRHQGRASFAKELNQILLENYKRANKEG